MSRFELKGSLDRQALEKALSHTAERHSWLRSIFPIEAGRPVRYTWPAGEIALLCHDLSGTVNAPEKARELARQEARRSYVLVAPVFRPVLFSLGANEHWLILVLHELGGDTPRCEPSRGGFPKLSLADRDWRLTTSGWRCEFEVPEPTLPKHPTRWITGEGIWPGRRTRWISRRIGLARRNAKTPGRECDSALDEIRPRRSGSFVPNIRFRTKRLCWRPTKPSCSGTRERATWWWDRKRASDRQATQWRWGHSPMR